MSFIHKNLQRVPCFYSSQVTFEDYFMSDMNMPAMKIVGYEGVIGTFLMTGLVLPVVYFLPGEEGQGLHEDTLETLHMIANSPGNVLALVLLVDVFALCMYNLSGMQVTGEWWTRGLWL